MQNLTPAEFDSFAATIAEKVADRLANRPRYLGREEMAADLGVSVSAVDRYAKQGIIPTIKLEGRVLFDPEQVRDSLRKKSGAG